MIFNLYRFDLELEKWGVDVNAFKEPGISHNFVGWTEEWEKVKLKTDSAVNKVFFSIKYKDLHFVLPDTGLMYYICEEDIVFRRRSGWVVYAQCDVSGVEEDEVTILSLLLWYKKNPQVDGVKVMHREEGSNCDRVWNPDEDN